MIGAFYSQALGAVRVITIYDPQKETLNPPLAGEGLLVIDPAKVQLQGAGDVQAHVTQQTGIALSEGRYVAVQNGVVVAVDRGVDPACGDIPFNGTQFNGAQIIATNVGDIGYTFLAGIFTAPIIPIVQKALNLGA